MEYVLEYLKIFYLLSFNKCLHIYLVKYVLFGIIIELTIFIETETEKVKLQKIKKWFLLWE